MKTHPASTDPVRAYLREIGQIPMLTSEQEIAYGKQVQQWVALVNLKDTLTAELGHEPNLNEWANAANLSLLQLQKKVANGCGKSSGMRFLSFANGRLR